LRVGDGIEIDRADIAFRSVGINPEPQRRQRLREVSRTSLINQNAAMGIPGIGHWCYDGVSHTHQGLELIMANEKGPNIKKKQKCKNCEGKGLLKKGDKVVKCQRCGGTGVR
jgi:hypothetical protein